MAGIVVTTQNRRFATWFFDGFNTAALDVRFDETPPTLRGNLAIPGTTQIGNVVPSPRILNDYLEIQAFYQGQGITASDVQKMTSRDALLRVPVATLRARSFADVPQPLAGSFSSDQLRGTVTKLQKPLRTVNNDVVPAQL